MTHESFFETDKKQRKIFFQQWLPEQETTGIIALVHGLGEHSGRYSHVAEFFTSQGIVVIAVDTYGHGQTTGKRGHADSMEAYMEQISRLLELAKQTVPDKPVFLYGHSMGGALVLNYLFRHTPTISGVIVTSPAVRPGFELPKPLLIIGKIARIIAPSFTQANSLDLENLSHDHEVIEKYKADPLVHNQVSGMVGISLIEWGEWLLQNARYTTVPVLLMHGTEDKLTSYEASKLLASQLSGTITFKSYEGLFHELHNEFEKQSVLNDMMMWIQKHL
ncbi:alpha/beta hydrolase [Emticicia sp. BO119]|uniref:alpha/beta hydrolase n=1 Tax=Emticicia sp. BO119 TaxID=2757768 RepID=UPI0015F10A98|nr:alpha/beta hydrolase [Emticicia sp. BO119]MBA4854029.1 alpha/beta hydrolase [Emticicia sp. BO119]